MNLAPTWQHALGEPPGDVHRLLCSLQNIQQKVYITLGKEVANADPDLVALEHIIQDLVACDLERQRLRHKQRLCQAGSEAVLSPPDAERERAISAFLS